MKTLKSSSLGQQISNKISTWILILVVIIVLALLSTVFLSSQQMFNKQVNSWYEAAPRHALASLMDSDHFSITREIEFLKSTGLFSSFIITDNQKNVIAEFGNDELANLKLIPIKDQAKEVWGYYYLKPDFAGFFSAYLTAGGILLILILAACFVIRWRIRSHLETEFNYFHKFLAQIEMVTENLNDIYNEGIRQLPAFNTEQITINRAITRLFDEIKKSNQALREAIVNAEERRFREELTRTVLQVSHDIGSPLASLESIVQSTVSHLEEGTRISIRNATSRLRDISNTLLKKAKYDLQPNDEPLAQHILYDLITQVISEKRMQYNSKISIETKFSNDAYKLFSFIIPVEFGCVLSNLINNSIEASQIPKIIIELFELNRQVIIKIEDNGRGIPKEILNKVGELGNTYGKQQGHGLGLFHAIKTINSWNGKLEIQSEDGKGTTVQMSLPLAPIPDWFLSEIKITKDYTIVVIDDDKAIHDVWEARFKTVDSAIELIHFYSPEEVLKWENQSGSILYLCDYEFIGSNLNGIELIKKLQINYLSILVTSRVSYEIISECEVNGIKILPKKLSNLVSILI